MKWIIAALTGGLWLSPADAEPFAPKGLNGVSYRMVDKTIVDVQINGPISMKTYDSIYDLVSLKRGFTIRRAYLSSPGGNVYWSMQLGDRMRTERATTIVDKEHHCNSACMFVLVGGYSRITDGKVHIHRPFRTEASTNKMIDEGPDEEDRSMINRYFRKMNIPESLTDHIMKVPAASSHLLTKAEIDRYKLNHKGE